jgi:serpin B
MKGRTRTPAAAVAALLAALIGCGAFVAAGHAAGSDPVASVASRSAGTTIAGVAAIRPAAAQAAAAATQKLGLALLSDEAAAGNAVISPFSVEEALAMVDQGATGVTAAQLGTVLGISDPGALAASTRALLAQLATVTATSGDGSTRPLLTNANGLWLASSLTLQPQFLDTLTRQFAAAPHQVDFAGAPEAARQAINDWVAAHTAGQIKDLFPDGTIGRATLLVLANAIDLKARWLLPFDPRQTKPGPFHLASGGTRQARFMTGDDPMHVPWARTATYAAVDLPYRGTSLSLLAVMPTSQSLRSFLSALTPAGFSRIAGSLGDSQPVQVSFPRLNLDVATDLAGDLSALGMPAAFQAPGFSGIVAHRMLTISSVRHEATLKITEEGTVATAATGIGFTSLSYGGQGQRIAFDHPFLVFLRDRATGALLFAGAISDPGAGS